MFHISRRARLVALAAPVVLLAASPALAAATPIPKTFTAYSCEADGVGIDSVKTNATWKINGDGYLVVNLVGAVVNGANGDVALEVRAMSGTTRLRGAKNLPIAGGEVSKKVVYKPADFRMDKLGSKTRADALKAAKPYRIDASSESTDVHLLSYAESEDDACLAE